MVTNSRSKLKSADVRCNPCFKQPWPYPSRDDDDDQVDQLQEDNGYYSLPTVQGVTVKEQDEQGGQVEEIESRQ